MPLLLQLLLQLLFYLLRLLFMPLLALALVFEEWGWEPLAALLARLSSLPFWAWLERQIRALPRWGALLVFGVPMLGLLPVKLLALYMLGHGHVWASLAVLVGAKVAGTAVAARLFQLTQPALMQFGWFAHGYPRWKAWKDGLLARVRQSAPWRTVRRIKADLRRVLRRVASWLRRTP
jgi:hypothetical protein